MPWIISGLAASVATWFVSTLTSKPAITIAQGEIKNKEETTFFKWGFYTLVGIVAVAWLRGLKK